MAKIRLLFHVALFSIASIVLLNALALAQGDLDPSTYLQEAIKRYGTRKPAEPAKGPFLYLLFSFSMPMPSIERMAADAEKAGGIMVLRGLVDNSGKKTRDLITALAKEHKVEVDIDPTVYRKYSVMQVPSVVLVRKACPTCQDPAPDVDYVKVDGDVTLSYALEQLERNYPDWHDLTDPYQIRLKGNSP